MAAVDKQLSGQAEAMLSLDEGQVSKVSFHQASVFTSDHQKNDKQ